MTASRDTIVPAGANPEREFSLDRAAELTGLHPEMILEFVRADFVRVLGSEAEGAPQFDELAIARLRHIEYLRSCEKVSLRTVCYIVRLLNRIDATDRELRSLRERMR